MGNSCVPPNNHECELCLDNNNNNSNHGMFSNGGCIAVCETCEEHALYCSSCWKKWILTCEEQGLPTPTCPNCRGQLEGRHVRSLIGRAYNNKKLHQQAANHSTHAPSPSLFARSTTFAPSPRHLNRPPPTRQPPTLPPPPPLWWPPSSSSSSSSSAPGSSSSSRPNHHDDDASSFHDVLRNLNYRVCPNCHHGIERAGGCPAMQCLCGERFCWQCGLSVATVPPFCECQLTRHCRFYNNASRQEEEEQSPPTSRSRQHRRPPTTRPSTTRPPPIGLTTRNQTVSEIERAFYAIAASREMVVTSPLPPPSFYHRFGRTDHHGAFPPPRQQQQQQQLHPGMMNHQFLGPFARRGNTCRRLSDDSHHAGNSMTNNDPLWGSGLVVDEIDLYRRSRTINTNTIHTIGRQEPVGGITQWLRQGGVIR